MPKKAIWQTTIGLAGFTYLVLVFAGNIQSPIFAAVFILVAGYEVIGSHNAKNKR